ncbi:MAG TPA: condensation domain-containing protein [Streptosporangiaceae bacterium]|nr:condensation domain-containing protein [Streptosporangiaceae bacterium]
MFEQTSRDRIVVQFTGAEAGAEPLTWGQKAILGDMQDSGDQFSMGGRIELPRDCTVDDAAALLSGLMGRHAALRMRLGSDSAGRPCQAVAGSGQVGLDILTIPDDADAARFAAELMDAWPAERFDFRRDWPLRMAVIRQRGACLYLVWVLSHLAADGGAHVLLGDLIEDEAAGRAPGEDRRPHVLDVARSEQTPKLRQLSARAMQYWEAQLRHIPAQTFGEPAHEQSPGGPRYAQARFSSPAAHLAVRAIARRTGTDASRVTLAVIATAIGRATGVAPLTIKVTVNNRFRPGLADVIAPVAQNSVVTIDATGTSVDEVVARARGAMMTAGMRAYYDPDDLREVTAKLDAERGYPARVTCRVNDQRAMTMGAGAEADLGEVAPEQVRRKLAETTLTWLGPRDHMHEQLNILVEPRPGVVSLHLMWDRWSLTTGQVEAIAREVEAVAVEAASDPAAPTRVPGRPNATR